MAAKACIGEWAWWAVVESVVAPILASAGSGSYCLAHTPRSVVVPQADRSVKRRRLTALLSGGVGTLEINPANTVEQRDGLADDFTVIERDNQRWLGIRKVGDARWRFLEGNEFYLRELEPDPDCEVIVIDPTKLATDVRDGAVYSEHVELLQEQFCAGGHVIVVMPHTAWTELLVDAVLQNSQQIGRPRNDTDKSWKQTHSLQVAQPLVVAGEFAATGLAGEDVGWCIAEDLESARKLVATRFDIDVGLWDLVNNETLRTTLLNPKKAPPIPPAASLPPAVRNRSRDRARDRDQARDEERRLHSELVGDLLTRLSGTGWEAFPGTLRSLFLALAKPYAKWEGQEPRPPLSLGIRVNKRNHRLVLTTSEYNRLDLGSELLPLTGTIAQITGFDFPPQAGVGSSVSLVEWPTGWGDDFDSDRLVKELVRVTPLLREVLDPLARKCDRMAHLYD